MMSDYFSYIKRGRLEIRKTVASTDQFKLLHQQTSYEIKKLQSIDSNQIRDLISQQKFGMYLIEDDRLAQIRGYNFTPYKLKYGDFSHFNICSIYPRVNQSNHDKSILGHLIDPQIIADRAMISHEFGSNFPGHTDIEANFIWPEDSEGLKVILLEKTSAIFSDEMVNRYYASKTENNWITFNNGFNKHLMYHNHELAGDGAVIAVRGDIKFNNINNEHPVKAKSIEEARGIGLNLINHQNKGLVYILKPKLNGDLSLYSVNSELDIGMRKNKTVVIDINKNSVIEMMTWQEGISYIEKSKTRVIL